MYFLPKSTKTARGTCFPAPVSMNESSEPPRTLSDGIYKNKQKLEIKNLGQKNRPDLSKIAMTRFLFTFPCELIKFCEAKQIT